jgi:hypothetical protein
MPRVTGVRSWKCPHDIGQHCTVFLLVMRCLSRCDNSALLELDLSEGLGGTMLKKSQRIVNTVCIAR